MLLKTIMKRIIIQRQFLNFKNNKTQFQLHLDYEIRPFSISIYYCTFIRGDTHMTSTLKRGRKGGGKAKIRCYRT